MKKQDSNNKTEKNIKETVKAILTVITFIAFLGLIIFAIIYNTIKNQLMNTWYWGVIGALVAGLVVSVKWFFGGKK